MRTFILIIMMITSLNVCADIDSFVIKNKNGDEINVTRNDMETLPNYKITTSTNFTPRGDFIGVKFQDLMKYYKLSGGKIRVFALDDYSFTININEMIRYNVIVAYKMNGEYMKVSELGPFAIIYPIDQFPELESLSVNAKTVWQIKFLEVK
jgi:hypothetical protein